MWIETPSNPLLRIVDIAAVAEAAHAVGALVVADNTFLSPIWQRPLDLGADIVLHSTTKYLNGHSDVVGGAVIARTTEQVAGPRAGGRTRSASPARRSTVSSRCAACARCTRACACTRRTRGPSSARSAAISAVARVYYPGLEDHPGHALARRQQTGFGAMLSFELAGGEPAVEAFLDGLECFTLAESLGGVESLIAHPATMTHAGMDANARLRAGIGPGLLRVSVGIEDPADLTADLESALRRAARGA